jgi:hypothetical protein
MTQKNKGIAQDGYQPRAPSKNQTNGGVNGGYTPSKQIAPPSPPPKKP